MGTILEVHHRLPTSPVDSSDDKEGNHEKDNPQEYSEGYGRCKWRDNGTGKGMVNVTKHRKRKG